MPKYDFELTTVSQILENDTVLTQALLFPERSFFGDNLNQTKIFARNYAKSLIQKIPHIDVHRYQLADFCNAIIIMTSNLGAESFQKGEMGFAEGINTQDRALKHFSSEVRKFLRPEMFNRIDAIVPFSPLDRDTVRRIARKELDMFTISDGIQLRNLEAGMGEGVADWLAIRGFDPLYGARPLKRTLEQEIVVPLAKWCDILKPVFSIEREIEFLLIERKRINNASGKKLEGILRKKYQYKKSVKGKSRKQIRDEVAKRSASRFDAVFSRLKEMDLRRFLNAALAKERNFEQKRAFETLLELFSEDNKQAWPPLRN